MEKTKKKRRPEENPPDASSLPHSVVTGQFSSSQPCILLKGVAGGTGNILFHMLVMDLLGIRFRFIAMTT